MDVPATLRDFSLVRGGPFFRLESRLGLAGPRSRLRTVRVLAVTLLGWLPLLLLVALHADAEALRAFARDFPVHIQMLVAIPVLLAAEPYIDNRLNAAARQLVASGLVVDKDLGALEEAARAAMRKREWPAVEGLLLVVSCALSLDRSIIGARPEWLSSGPGHTLTPAGAWLLAVSLPLFRFLMFRWLWRGLVWALFLFQVSRLPLALVPTHPDGAGGLQFLATCQASFAVVVFGLACSVTSYTYRGTSPSESILALAMPLLTFAAVALVLVFSPLLVFSRPMLEAKRRGDLQFSELAARHSRRFEERWFRRDIDEGELLEAPDFSSLTDLGTSFGVARSMLWFPFSVRAVASVVGAALLPLTGILVADRQLAAVLLKLVQSLL